MKIQYNIKIEKTDLALIKKISSQRGEDKSDFIRRAIRRELSRFGVLSKDESKVLEV